MKQIGIIIQFLVITIFSVSFCLVNGQNRQLGKENYTQYVNPFIGTGAASGSSLSGNNFPGATLPFGMVQLSPDTREFPNWSAASGYDANDAFIYGFSHTHLSGTGVGELFDIMVLPVSRKIDVLNATRTFRSSFSHAQESAHPGYYQVNLLSDQINVELTATEHAGFQRFEFQKDSARQVIIDLNHSMDRNSWGSRILDAQIRLVNDHTIEGYRLITGWAKFRKIYFYAEFSEPVITQIMVDGSMVDNQINIIYGSTLKTILKFKKSQKKLLLKLGISPVSLANAKLNLLTEIPDFNFNKIVKKADATWEKQLSKIEVDGTIKQKRQFYTGLYHSFIQPNKMSDVNGQYQGADYSTHQIKTGGYYSTFSLWDSYRAASPLYTLIQADKTTSFINSMLEHYKAYGYLPIWSLWGEENYCMIGNHAIPVIVNAVLSGIKGFNIQTAYEAVVASSTTNHPGSPFSIWEKYQYMPENLQTQSVSLTLEMCFDDWCVAQFAKMLGKDADYTRFMQRSGYYKHLFDQSTGFFRGKDDKGNWLPDFNPLQYGANGGNPYVEGNAWQYLWYVPQNIPDLIQLLGGTNQFTTRLDQFFNLQDSSIKRNDNASGMIGQYAHGNEPSHHIAYLYDYSSAPWKTQYYTTEILETLYNDSYSGYAGNEDCGQMSAWYIFSAMGIYPVNPSSGVYAISSPILKKATIHLSNGRNFVIEALNASRSNRYIQSARLNNIAYNHAYLTQKELLTGGVLSFIMGDKPNKKWGSNNQDSPINYGY